jgi:hypothetical protein
MNDSIKDRRKGMQEEKEVTKDLEGSRQLALVVEC